MTRDICDLIGTVYRSVTLYSTPGPRLFVPDPQASKHACFACLLDPQTSMLLRVVHTHTVKVPCIIFPFLAPTNCISRIQGGSCSRPARNMGLRPACLAALVAAASGAFEGFYCGESSATNYVANPQPGECRALCRAPRSRTCACVRTSLSALCDALGAKGLRAPACVQLREHPPPARMRADLWQPQPQRSQAGLAHKPQRVAQSGALLSLLHRVSCRLTRRAPARACPPSRPLRRLRQRAVDLPRSIRRVHGSAR